MLLPSQREGSGFGRFPQICPLTKIQDGHRAGPDGWLENELGGQNQFWGLKIGNFEELHDYWLDIYQQSMCAGPEKWT